MFEQSIKFLNIINAPLLQFVPPWYNVFISVILLEWNLPGLHYQLAFNHTKQSQQPERNMISHSLSFWLPFWWRICNWQNNGLLNLNLYIFGNIIPAFQNYTSLIQFSMKRIYQANHVTKTHTFHMISRNSFVTTWEPSSVWD